MRFILHVGLLTFVFSSSSYGSGQERQETQQENSFENGEQQQTLKVHCEHMDDFWCKYVACEGAKLAAKKTCENQVYLETSREVKVENNLTDFFARVGTCTLTYQCANGPLYPAFLRDLNT